MPTHHPPQPEQQQQPQQQIQQRDGTNTEAKQNSKGDKKSTSKTFVCGLVAGLASTVAGYPLDVARVRLLFGETSTRNLSNGFAFSFAYSIVKSGFVWPLQNHFQKIVEEKHVEPAWLGVVVSGAIGNVIPGIVCNPANVIKVRYMETTSTPAPLSTIVKDIIKNEGFIAFRKGTLATLARDSIWGMLYFPLCSQISHHFATSGFLGSHQTHDNTHNDNNTNNNVQKRANFTQFLTASTLAASISTMATSVLDGVRLYEMKKPTEEPHSFFKALRKVLQPTRYNLLSAITGVGRVSVATVIGHLVFRQSMTWMSQDFSPRS